VVGALEPHHLEGERFLAEILRGAEPHLSVRIMVPTLTSR
jgi:hypothetical protein